MVTSEIEQLLDTPLDDFNSGTSSRRGRGRGGTFQRGGGSWRAGGRGGRGRRLSSEPLPASGGHWRGGGSSSRGRTHVSGLSSNTPSRRWQENNYSSNSSSTRDNHWRGGGRSSRTETRMTTRKRSSPVVISTSGEVVVTGLDSSITSDDVHDIFNERIGVVTKAYVVFDKSGKPMGEANVTFAKRSDAKKAVDTLDGALVDGKKISVRLANSDSASYERESRPSKRSRVSPGIREDRFDDNNGRISRSYGSMQSTRRAARSSKFGDMPPEVSNPLDRTNSLTMSGPRGREGGRGRGRGGGRGGFRGRGRGRGRGDNWNDNSVTAEDLDKELDSYLH